MVGSHQNHFSKRPTHCCSGRCYRVLGLLRTKVCVCGGQVCIKPLAMSSASQHTMYKVYPKLTTRPSTNRDPPHPKHLSRLLPRCHHLRTSVRRTINGGLHYNIYAFCPLIQSSSTALASSRSKFHNARASIGRISAIARFRPMQLRVLTLKGWKTDFLSAVLASQRSGRKEMVRFWAARKERG